MSKSEYFEPATVPGERPVPSIKLDADKLLGLLLRAEVMMTSVDRRRYGDRAIDAIEDVIRDFSLAYDFEEERIYYLKKMWADLAVFLTLVRTIGEHNCIRIMPQHETMSPDTMKLEIYNSVARLDEGAARWKRSLRKYRNKGTTPTAG